MNTPNSVETTASKPPVRRPARLLLGPTGAGKTPLGDMLEAQGLAGRRCCHFDFGAQLRAVDAGQSRPSGLDEADRAFIHEVLTAGALLEDRTFYIAERLLQGFIDAQNVNDADLLILNGLPRHCGQARAVDGIVRIERVVYLECDADTVAERIRRDTGGDRAVRTDDSLPEIRRKLAVFRERTLPLLDHYRTRGVYIAVVNIGVSTTAWDVIRILEKNDNPPRGQS